MPDIIPLQVPHAADAPPPALAGCFRAGEIVALLLADDVDRSEVVRSASGAMPANAAHLTREPALRAWLSLSENVAFGRGGLSPFSREGLVANALGRTGLGGLAQARPGELDAEQRHAVALARIYLSRPAALLMDEPFAPLSHGARARLEEILLTFWRESRPGIVLTTRDAGQAARLADRILVLRGRTPRIVAGFVNLQPRPRDPESAGMRALRREVARTLMAAPFATPRPGLAAAM